MANKLQKFKITQLLATGEANAKTARDLATITGLTLREVTLQIAKERQDGAVILSSGKGYFLPGNIEEVLHFCRTMDSRAKNIYLASRSAKALLSQVPGQTDLEGGGG